MWKAPVWASMRGDAALYATNVAWDAYTDVALYGEPIGSAVAINLAFGLLNLPGNSESRLVRGIAGGIGDGGDLPGLERLGSYARQNPADIDEFLYFTFHQGEIGKHGEIVEPFIRFSQ